MDFMEVEADAVSQLQIAQNKLLINKSIRKDY